MTKQIQTLKQLIRLELNRCDPLLWPNVCEMIATDEGYHRIENMILRYAAQEALQVGSSIALIEQEFAHAKQ